MSLIALRRRATLAALPRPAARLLLAVAAVGVVALLFAVVLRVGFGGTPPPARNPFGGGLREAAPTPGMLGDMLLTFQSRFSQALTAALAASREGGSAWSWIGLAFAYGVFHAAGPGHGKAVISGYLLATRRTLKRGLALSIAASLLQATVAIGIVLAGTMLLRATATGMSGAVALIERASFVILALVGAGLVWRKTGPLVPARTALPFADLPFAMPVGERRRAASLDACTCCDGPHIPAARAVEEMGQERAAWRDAAGIVLAAGLRPCSGAVILLVFAAAQGLMGTGILAVFAMAAGTAATTGALAALAVGAKRTALKLAGERWSGLIAAGELGVAAAVAILGFALATGAAAGGAG